VAFQHRPARRPRSAPLLPWRTGASEELAASLSMLAATLESTADGILVVDLHGRVVGRNAKFSRMWGLPDDVVAKVSLLDQVMDQVVDPDGFLARVHELYARPEVAADDEVELRDGRVFSRYTQPQSIDGRVVGRVWSFRDRTAERRLELDLRRMAYHDELTGLANRALFMERGHELALAARSGAPLAVAVLDLDNLKVVNDRLGHQSGDEILRVTASRLCSAARVGDLVARLGGDEFGVLMPDAPPATAAAVLQRMSDAMTGPMGLGARRVQASLSGGSSVHVAEPVSLETLLHEADLAMYRAKSEGGGRVHAYDDEGIARTDPRTGAAELAELLADPAALLTVRQPICDLSSGVLVGHESLTRFPGRGHREVGEWFALARDDGRGPALEAWAVRQARATHEPSGGTYLTVNVSPAVLGTPAVVQALSGDLSDVVVELTDDDPTDLARLSHELDALRRQGARIAMDETGSGYDGLRRLVRLRPDVVKVDRRLVHEVQDHPAKRALVEALVSFCQQTGSTLCAEGIETVEELRALVDLGVDLGQGWFVGRPAAGRPLVTPAATAACGGIGDAAGHDMDLLRAHLDRATTTLEVARAAQRSLAALQADEIGLSVLQGGDLVMVRPRGWTAAEQRYDVDDYPATAACLRDGTPLAIRTDDPGADGAEARALREVGYGSVLVLPLRTEDRPTGVVEVFCRAQRSWSERQLRLGVLLAEEVADALDRVNRSVPSSDLSVRHQGEG